MYKQKLNEQIKLCLLRYLYNFLQINSLFFPQYCCFFSKSYPFMTFFPQEFMYSIFIISSYKQKMNEKENTKDSIYKKRWNQLYKSEQSKTYLTGSVDDIKLRQQGSHFLLYNSTRKSKLPNKETVELKVSLPFDKTKFNYCNVFNKQVLFYLDLDNEIFVKNQHKDFGNQKMRCPPNTHPVIMNISPLYQYQSLLVVYPYDGRSQVITENILTLVLNIYRLFPNIKIGYNSIGCGSVNHLHFHLLYSDPILEKFPIQTAEQIPWIQVYLKNQELYFHNIRVNQINFQNSCIFVLKPVKQEEQIEFQARRQLGFVFDLISKEAIELNLPYNLYISDQGQTVYMMIRDFDNRYGWLEYCGIIVVGEGQFEMREETILQRKKCLQIKQPLLGRFKSNVQAALRKCLI